MILDIILIAVGAYLVAGISVAIYYNRGETVPEDRATERFSRINFKGAGKLVVTQSDKDKVQVESKKNYLSQLYDDTQGDTLVLGQKINLLYILFVWILPRPTYYVSASALNTLHISGATNVEIRQLEVPDLTIKVSGSSKIVAMIDVDNLNVEVSGSMNAKLSGTAKNQSIKSSGSSKYDAYELKTQATKIQISGSSRTMVYAEETLDVNISGSANVSYKGSPQLSQNISGAGKISQAS